MDDRSGCAEIVELLPDVAAGVSAGDERARAFAHLAECSDCRQELAALSYVADELLTLAPAVAPPAGFAAGLMRRVAPPRRRRNWWRAFRVALAVLLAAVAGSSATMGATADDRREAHHCRERPLAERAFAAADGTPGGRAFAYGGAPPWLFVTVALPAAAGVYDVHLVTRDGRSRAIGAVPVSGGGGSWGVALDVPADQIAEVRLIGSAGPPLTAGFR
jgi:hypothetical protein